MNRSVHAVLGDIHSNQEALSAVLEDAAANGVSSYACIGDVVGYGVDPASCLERLQSLDCVMVRGNHEHYCAPNMNLEAFSPVAHPGIYLARQQLSKIQLEYITHLPMTRIVDGFTIVHGSLDSPELWGYVFDTLDAATHFNYQTTSVCFCGHSHWPMAYEQSSGLVRVRDFQGLHITLGKKYLINVGSVGQPRDHDPRASYVIYDLNTGQIVLRRVPYNVGKTQLKIRKAGFPEALVDRLQRGG